MNTDVCSYFISFHLFQCVKKLLALFIVFGNSNKVYNVFSH